VSGVEYVPLSEGFGVGIVLWFPSTRRYATRLARRAAETARC
jgi:hypothetical protein